MCVSVSVCVCVCVSVNSKKAESQKKVSPTPATRNTMTVNVSHAEKQNPRGSCNQLQSKHIEGRPDTLDGGLTGSCGSKHTPKGQEERLYLPPTEYTGRTD